MRPATQNIGYFYAICYFADRFSFAHFLLDELCGVAVKHLKSKIRPEENGKENSPWNISSDFNIDMSLSESGIKGMLDEYEADHCTGMNTVYMAKLIWEQTSGYPFLVSRICQLIDEQVCQNMQSSEAWTKKGFLAAIRLILSEKNTLFQTLTKNLKEHPQLKAAIRSILMDGTSLTYSIFLLFHIVFRYHFKIIQKSLGSF